MPITEKEMSHADMLNAVNDGYLCAECQGRLSAAWGGIAFNCWILRCDKDINHYGITRHDIKYENLKKEHLSMDSNALMTMDEKGMLARVEMAKFPQDLTPADKKLLAQVAMTYGFDPLMGEVTIYQGRPFVSIDGRYRKAQETGQLDGVESRPASKQERADWQIPDGDFFFRADVYVKNSTRPFTGWGRVFAAEITGGKGYKPVEKNPQRMAEKRAEAQALRKAFHINLPSLEEKDSPDLEPVQVIDVAPPAKEAPAAVHASSEAKQQDINKNVASKPPAAVQPSQDAQQAGEKAPETLTLKKVLEWCSSHGRQFGPTWFYKNQSVFKESDKPTEKQLSQAMSEIISVTSWDGI